MHLTKWPHQGRKADRLKVYLKEKRIHSDQRIFPICYEAARAMVKKAGDVVGVKLRPHDLRQHAFSHESMSSGPAVIASNNNIGILGNDTRWKGVRPSATEKVERLSGLLDHVITV